MRYRVGVVVCHHRNAAVVSTLSSLARQTLSPARVVVVDNASGPGWVARIREAAPWAEVLAAPVNGGYAAGMNLGLRALAGDHLDAVVLATHEVELAPDTLAVLVERLVEQPAVGAVGPLLVWRSDPKRVWSAGGVLDPATWRPGHRNEPADAGSWADAPPQDADWLDGALLVLRPDALERVGYLDERYFLYFEEVDLCLRIRQSGFRVECVPAAVASQASPGVPVYLAARNWLLLVRRFAPDRVPGGAVHLAGVALGHLVHGRRAAFGPALRGLRDGLLGRCGAPPPGVLDVRLDPEWRAGLRLAGRR